MNTHSGPWISDRRQPRTLRMQLFDEIRTFFDNQTDIPFFNYTDCEDL